MSRLLRIAFFTFLLAAIVIFAFRAYQADTKPEPVISAVVQTTPPPADKKIIDATDTSASTTTSQPSEAKTGDNPHSSPGKEMAQKSKEMLDTLNDNPTPSQKQQ